MRSFELEQLAPTGDIQRIPTMNHKFLSGANWSLSQLDIPAFRDALGRELQQKGISDTFAPYPDFSARIAGREEFDTPIVLNDTVRILRGTFADGIVLQPGESFIMSVVNCPIVAVQLDDRVCVANAGRWSLLDKEPVFWGQEGREHASVVEAALSALNASGRNLRRTHVYVFGGVEGRLFRHSPKDHKNGDRNSKIAEYIRCEYPETAEKIFSPSGNFDLGELIRAQAIRAGIPEACVHKHNSQLSPLNHFTSTLEKKSNLLLVKFGPAAVS